MNALPSKTVVWFESPLANLVYFPREGKSFNIIIPLMVQMKLNGNVN